MLNDCSQKVSHFIDGCVVHSWLWFLQAILTKSLHGWVLERSPSAWRVSVKTSANCWHKFPSNYKLAQSILRRKCPSKCKPSRCWDANFPPYISPSQNKPLKKGHEFESYKWRRQFFFAHFHNIAIECIECFHSRGQHLCKFIGTKESVCIRKEFNSQRFFFGTPTWPPFHCFGTPI